MNGFKYACPALQRSGNLRTPDGEAPNTSFRQKEGSAFLSYDFSDKFTVGGGLDSFKGSIHSGSMEPGYENFAVDVPKWQRDKVYAFAEAKNVTPWLPRVRFDAFWQKNEKEMTNDVNTDPAITKMPLVVTNNADNRNKQLGSSLQMDWAIGDNHYLITGYDISYDTLKADTRLRLPLQWSASLPPASWPVRLPLRNRSRRIHGEEHPVHLHGLPRGRHADERLYARWNRPCPPTSR